MITSLSLRAQSHAFTQRSSGPTQEQSSGPSVEILFWWDYRAQYLACSHVGQTAADLLSAGCVLDSWWPEVPGEWW